MARFSYHQELDTVADVPGCQTAVAAGLQALGARIEASNGETRARMGSQLQVRLLGGFLAPRSAYPLAIGVQVRDQGAQRTIATEVSEAFGFGTILGVEGRYRSHCQDVLQRLSREIAARLPGS